MGSASIQAKIKKGLAKAINKTGSSNSLPVYLVSKTVVGGDGTPLDPGTITTVDILLVDAVFTSYDKAVFNENIESGDRQLVSNNDVEIKQGDVIKQGTQEYLVVAVDVKAPTSDVLAYIAQVRAK